MLETNDVKMTGKPLYHTTNKEEKDLSDERPKDVERKEVTPPAPEAFMGKQLDFFRNFTANGQEVDKLSNAFFLWDSVPRYGMSKQLQDKKRKIKGYLPLHRVKFEYQGNEYAATIQAARIWTNKEKTEDKDFYPSANEELIEDALRKIAAERDNAFIEIANKQARSGVRFTLHMLREELKRRGHERNYKQIYQSLMILWGSKITIETTDGKGEAMTGSTYFSALTVVSKSKIKEDPQAKWYVEFHPLITRGINTLAYRQYNYAKNLSFKNQLTRWIHKQLCLKHRAGGVLHPVFSMYFSTIKRDSALLDGYKSQKDAVRAVENALNEMKADEVLSSFIPLPTLGLRGKIENVEYKITMTRAFWKEATAANHRQNAIEKKL